LKPLPELTAAAAACGASVEVRTRPAAGGEGPLRVVTIRLGDKVAALGALAQRFALLTDSAMNTSMFVQRSAPGRRTL
jgi:hypothetical protein